MKVGLGLGSNLGDRLRNLQLARDYLRSRSRDGWHRAAPVYETEPVDCAPEAPRFLNTVIEIEYDGEARTLLQEIQAYEQAHGRSRARGRNASRPIDIDLLYFGEEEIREKDLVVPHPRLARRRFVLEPLATLHPDLPVRGTGRTVAELMRDLPVREGEVRFVQSTW